MVQYEFEGKVFQVEAVKVGEAVARMTVLLPQPLPSGEKRKVVVEYDANRESAITLPPMPKAMKMQMIFAIQWKFDRIVQASVQPPHTALIEFFKMRKARELQAEVNKK